MGVISGILASGAVRILGDALIKPVLEIFAKKTDADLAKYQAATGTSRDVALAQLAAETEANASRRALASMYFGWGPTRWLMWLAIAGPVVHMALIYLDSSCPASWGWGALDGAGRPLGGCGMRIPAAPAPYDEREWQIVITLLGIQKVPDMINALGRAVATATGRR